MSRKFGPKPPGHLEGRNCAACQVMFKEGDYTTLIPLGPGNDEEERERLRQGRTYSSVAIEIHWDCSAAAYSKQGD